MFLVDEIKGEAIILLHEDITEELAAEVNDFIYGVAYFDTIKSIRVSLNSCGGSVLGGMSIISSLLTASQDHGKIITTVIDGMACSIASVIFLIGTIRIVRDYSLGMIHNASGGEDKALLAIKESIMAVYQQFFNSEDELNSALNNETWYSADMMIANGMATSIIYTNNNENVKLDTSSVTNIYDLHELCNKIIKKENSQKMKKTYLEKLKEDLKKLTAKVTLKEEEEKDPKEEMESEASADEEEVMDDETPADEDMENSKLDQLQESVDALTELVQTLIDSWGEAKTENKALKASNEDKEKRKILSEAGIENKALNDWMKLDIETIKNLSKTVKVTAKAPTTKITNSSIEKKFDEMSMDEKKILMDSDMDKYMKMYFEAGKNSKKK